MTTGRINQVTAFCSREATHTRQAATEKPQQDAGCSEIPSANAEELLVRLLANLCTTIVPHPVGYGLCAQSYLDALPTTSPGSDQRYERQRTTRRRCYSGLISQHHNGRIIPGLSAGRAFALANAQPKLDPFEGRASHTPD